MCLIHDNYSINTNQLTYQPLSLLATLEVFGGLNERKLQVKMKWL